MRTTMLRGVQPHGQDHHSPEQSPLGGVSRRRERGAETQPEPPAWGSAERVAGCRAALDDLLRSRRALVPHTLLWEVAALVQQHVSPDSSRPAVTDVPLLMAVWRLCEHHWRRPVVSDFVYRRLFDRDLFAAWKCIDLLRNDRNPHDVTEGFVRCVGDVGSASLAARDVFWQRFRPLPPSQSGLQPSNKVLLMAPGFGETGRNFYEQIALLNRLGHEVVVIDQQWAGQTRNVDGTATPGILDRGFGAARDVARVAESVARQLPKNAQLILMGQGAGGTAILTLLVAQAAKLLDVPLPAKLDAVLQAPYLAPTPSSLNRIANLLARLPGGGNLPAHLLLPSPTPDAVAAKKYAQCRLRDNITFTLGALQAMRSDMQAMWDLLAAGYKPAGRVVVLHSAGDPWADASASHRLGHEEVLGRRASVRILPGANHALAHVASERQEALWGLQKLGVPSGFQPANA